MRVPSARYKDHEDGCILASIPLDFASESHQKAMARPSPLGSSAATILAQASKIVAGDRNDTHGDKKDTFIAIASAWEFYLRNRKDPDGPIRPQDVGFMMERLKEVRAEFGLPTQDHYLDAAGYVAISGEIVLNEETTKSLEERS